MEEATIETVLPTVEASILDPAPEMPIIKRKVGSEEPLISRFQVVSVAHYGN